MFRFFRDLCVKNDEEKLNKAIEKSCLTLNIAIGSSEFSLESNVLLRAGIVILKHLNELVDNPLTAEVQDKIQNHDLIIAGTIAIVLIANYFKYDDPLVPFNLKDLEAGLELNLSSVADVAPYASDDKKVQEALFSYVAGIGKKILIDKKFPLLEFDSPSGGYKPFHCAVDSLLINPHPEVKRHSCLKLYDRPGQRSAEYWGGGPTTFERSAMREKKRLAMVEAEKARVVAEAESDVDEVWFRMC